MNLQVVESWYDQLGIPWRSSSQEHSPKELQQAKSLLTRISSWLEEQQQWHSASASAGTGVSDLTGVTGTSGVMKAASFEDFNSVMGPQSE